MIVETLVVLAQLLGGAFLARTAGFRGWVLPAVGLTVGVAVTIVVTSVLALAGVGAPAWVPPAATLSLGALWWVRCQRRGEDVRISATWLVAATLVVTAAVAVFRLANPVRLTVDSFRYLATGGLLGSGRLAEASPHLLESRVLAVPALHAPALVHDELYLRSITPLVGIACVLILAWLVHAAAERSSSWISPGLLAMAAAALLLTTNRFVFHSFYINGHILLAAWVLLLAGIAWILMAGPHLSIHRPDGSRLVMLAVLILPAFVLTRPDAGVAALLIVLPVTLSAEVPRAHRWPLAATLGAAIVAWQAVLISVYRDAGSVPSSVVLLLALGGAILLAAVVIATLDTAWLPTWTLGLSEAALWVGVGGVVIIDRELIRSSLSATFYNVVLSDGGWGISLMLLGVLVAAALLTTRQVGRAALRFPITTFVPLYLLLAYLRDAAYRVGGGDSLNRAFIHMVPLAIMLVATSVVAPPRELRAWGRRSDARQRAAEPS